MILITGITGLTGRFLYEQIKRQAAALDQVSYLVRNSSDVSWMQSGENLVYADARDVESLKTAMQGAAWVLHLAPRSALPQVLEACKANGVHRLFYVNSTGIYSKFKPSTAADIENERLLRASGLTYTIIRPTMIYGNQQDGNIRHLVKVMNALPCYPILGKGEGYMQPIHAEDLAKVLLSALHHEAITRNQEYNVAGKRPLQYQELLLYIADALGKRRYFFHIPFGLALAAGRIADWMPNPILSYEKVLRLNEDKKFDYSKAERDLDFRPMAFEDGIKKEVAALRQCGIIR